MCSTPRTSTRSFTALRFRKRSDSGTRARRPTSRIEIDRTRPSQRSGVFCAIHPQLPRQIFTFTHPPPERSFIPRKPLALVMARVPRRSASSVSSEAWAMLGKTDLEATTCWDFPTQSEGDPDAGDPSFNGVTPARCVSNLVPRTAVLRTDGARLGRGPARAATGWCPRVDHRRRVPRWRLHPGRIPPSLGLVTRLRGPRHGRPRSPPRPLCVPPVGAPGPSVQLLPSGLQVPLHPEETGWGIGRLETWNQTMNGRAVRRARLCPPCARGCGLRPADAKIVLWNAQVGTGSPGGAEIWTGSSPSSARYEVVYRCSSFRGRGTSRTPPGLRDARLGPRGGAGSGPGLRSRRWLRSSRQPG